MRRFHHAFIDAGLALRFESLGRSPRSYYPTYRDLLTEPIPAGRPGTTWRPSATTRSCARSNSAISSCPSSGTRADRRRSPRLGGCFGERGENVTAFYTSNVEFYLFGRGTFSRFVANLRRLPRARGSLIIRSVFDGYARAAAPGYASASLTAPIDEMLDACDGGAIQSYRDLATADGRPRN